LLGILYAYVHACPSILGRFYRLPCVHPSCPLGVAVLRSTAGPDNPGLPRFLGNGKIR
jgi:hypothetical protein